MMVLKEADPFEKGRTLQDHQATVQKGAKPNANGIDNPVLGEEVLGPSYGAPSFESLETLESDKYLESLSAADKQYIHCLNAVKTSLCEVLKTTANPYATVKADFKE